MSALPDNDREWLEYYEALYEKNYDNYQNSGIKKYDTQAHKYDVICDAFRAKLYKKKSDEEVTKKRMLEAARMCEDLYKESYSRDEVKRLLYQAVRW